MKTLALALSLAACATTAPEPGYDDNGCRVAEVEPVSQCRAQYACGRGTARLFFAFLLSGMGSGLSGQPSAAQVNYDNCITREMIAQQLNRAH